MARRRDARGRRTAAFRLRTTSESRTRTLLIRHRSWLTRRLTLRTSLQVFATFNQLYKVAPHFWAAWANALRRAPGSVLWVLEFPRGASTNLAAHAAAEGIHVRRVRSAPTAERTYHLARATLVSLFLDTGPYSGHTSSGDALWMGVPVLSLLGDMMQSRVTASYAANTGCSQPVTRSLRHYEGTAARLAERPAARLEELRKCLARRRWTSFAFDTEQWVAAFDEGMRMVWENHRQGRRPAHVLLPSPHTLGAGGS